MRLVIYITKKRVCLCVCPISIFGRKFDFHVTLKTLMSIFNILGRETHGRIFKFGGIVSRPSYWLPMGTTLWRRFSYSGWVLSWSHAQVLCVERRHRVQRSSGQHGKNESTSQFHNQRIQPPHLSMGLASMVMGTHANIHVERCVNPPPN